MIKSPDTDLLCKFFHGHFDSACVICLGKQPESTLAKHCKEELTLGWGAADVKQLHLCWPFCEESKNTKHMRTS